MNRLKNMILGIIEGLGVVFLICAIIVIFGIMARIIQILFGPLFRVGWDIFSSLVK